MASEADVRAAETARLEEIVAAHGTEEERNWLPVVAFMSAKGLPVKESYGVYLGRVARRASRRAELGLPAERCATDPPNHYCSCLEQALDESRDEDGAKVVRALAGGLHWSDPPRRAEPIQPAEEQEKPKGGTGKGPASGRFSGPEPKPEPTPEPAFRVVKRTPKWWDRSTRFEDMRF